MKRLVPLLVILAVLVCAVAAVAGPKGKGARKVTTPMRIAFETPGAGEVAGRAIFNTDDEGYLMVNVHLSDGVPNMDFTVWVVIDGTWIEADLGMLSTNRKGKGNAHLELVIADYYDGVGDTLDVRVVVDNWYPGSMPLPYIGYASDHVEVPLKG